MKITANTKFIFDEKGNKIGVLMRIKEFKRLIEDLEDLKDLTMAYERTSKNFKSIPYEQIREELFGNDKK